MLAMPMPNFDARGAFLGELWFAIRGGAVDTAVLRAAGLKVVHAPPKRPPRWHVNATLFPEVFARGARYVHLDLSSPGPDYAVTHWDVKFFTCVDDTPFTYEDRFPGSYPADLLALLAAARIDATVDAAVVGQYAARRDRLGPRLDVIAPWLQSWVPSSLKAPHEATWESSSSGTLAAVRLRESSIEDTVLMKVSGTARTAISVESVDEIDQRLWREAVTFLSTIAEPRDSASPSTPLS